MRTYRTISMVGGCCLDITCSSDLSVDNLIEMPIVCIVKFENPPR